jgi:hypothetical protein
MFVEYIAFIFSYVVFAMLGSARFPCISLCLPARMADTTPEKIKTTCSTNINQTRG